MNTRPWKQQRIIELPHSRRQFETEPLLVTLPERYCGACGTSCTTQDAFCGMCGAALQASISSEYATVSFGLTGISWQRR